MFLYIQDAPLLVILDDLLQDLDQLLLQYERRSQSGVEGERGGGDMGGASEKGVDGQYVALLEMQCLLQQRMNDVQYRWWNIYDTLTALGKVSTDGCDTPYASTLNYFLYSFHCPSILAQRLHLLEYALENRCRLQPSLSTIIAHVSSLMELLTSEGQRHPRLFRLATHLKLTDKVIVCSKPYLQML